MSKSEVWTRRDVIELGIAASLAPALSFGSEAMISKPIPASGEALPVIGLGTWQVFDLPSTPEALAVPRQIVELLVAKGGSLIDSSPMYNRAEKVVGDIVAASGNRKDLFLATKVWTDGKAAGERQMQDSADLMNAGVIDLMQVHNRRDLDVQLATVREWQKEGRIRYSGVTDYRASALDEMEAAMKQYKPDFIQINYSLGERAADERLLPLAHEFGIAVLINRPFMGGRLFGAVRGRVLPEWAAAFAASWGQFFLKFIVSHPAVNCVIPATNDLAHMADNLGAGFGAMPDAAMRRKMSAYFSAI